MKTKSSQKDLDAKQLTTFVHIKLKLSDGETRKLTPAKLTQGTWC